MPGRSGRHINNIERQLKMQTVHNDCRNPRKTLFRHDVINSSTWDSLHRNDDCDVHTGPLSTIYCTVQYNNLVSSNLNLEAGGARYEYTWHSHSHGSRAIGAFFLQFQQRSSTRRSTQPIPADPRTAISRQNSMHQAASRQPSPPLPPRRTRVAGTLCDLDCGGSPLDGGLLFRP